MVMRRRAGRWRRRRQMVAGSLGVHVWPRGDSMNRAHHVRHRVLLVRAGLLHEMRPRGGRGWRRRRGRDRGGGGLVVEGGALGGQKVPGGDVVPRHRLLAGGARQCLAGPWGKHALLGEAALERRVVREGGGLRARVVGGGGGRRRRGRRGRRGGSQARLAESGVGRG